MIPKILIVGAGPSGLTLALELARQGIVPTIIDKKTEPSTLSRAVGIIPVTMELLESSGAAAKLKEESIVIEQAVFHEGLSELMSLKLDILKDSNQRLFSLPQDRTESILSEQLQLYKGKVDYGHCLESLEQDMDKVRVRINGQEELYDYVVGADGMKSQVREATAIDYPGYELNEDWSIADVYTQDERYSANFNIYLQDKGKVTLLIPLEKKRLRIISNTASAMSFVPEDLQVDKIKREGQFKIDIRQASKYQEARVFLVGDAAHCHSPVGGRGMNLGIADAVDLASRFVNNDLDSYHRVRHKIGKKLIASTERARKLILSPNRNVRNLLFSILRLITKSNFFSKIFLEKGLLAANTI